MRRPARRRPRRAPPPDEARAPWAAGTHGAPPCAAPRPPTAPARQETRVSQARRGRPLPPSSYGGRQLLPGDLIHDLAVRPALELWHDLSHELAEIRGSRGDRRADRLADLRGIRCGREK